MIKNGFIINPYYELLPDYKISPFSNNDLRKNRELPKSNYCDSYFNERFSNQKYTYTLNGRTALNIALSYFNLKPDDKVTILTTTGNYYISSCVTNEIEKFCGWSRSIEIKTKVIIINHEFGYPFEELAKIKKYNLPIIEDCAHSFFSMDKNKNIGTVGDFLIFSFSKIFPIQLGGILVSKHKDFLSELPNLNLDILAYIKKVISNYLKARNDLINKRLKNYMSLSWKFNNLGLIERFKLEKGIVPGVFMFKAEKIKIELPDLKKVFFNHGIQCSVFYGENTFFLPCHQNLDESDLDYFVEIIRLYIKE